MTLSYGTRRKAKSVLLAFILVSLFTLFVLSITSGKAYADTPVCTSGSQDEGCCQPGEAYACCYQYGAFQTGYCPAAVGNVAPTPATFSSSSPFGMNYIISCTTSDVDVDYDDCAFGASNAKYGNGVLQTPNYHYTDLSPYIISYLVAVPGSVSCTTGAYLSGTMENTCPSAPAVKGDYAYNSPWLNGVNGGFSSVMDSIPDVSSLPSGGTCLWSFSSGNTGWLTGDYPNKPYTIDDNKPSTPPATNPYPTGGQYFPLSMSANSVADMASSGPQTVTLCLFEWDNIVDQQDGPVGDWFVYSNTITAYPTIPLSGGTPSASPNPMLPLGTTTLSDQAIGGSAPYKYQWYQCSDPTCSSPTPYGTQSAPTSGPGTYPFTSTGINTYYFQVVVTDSAGTTATSSVLTLDAPAVGSFPIPPNTQWYYGYNTEGNCDVSPNPDGIPGSSQPSATTLGGTLLGGCYGDAFGWGDTSSQSSGPFGIVTGVLGTQTSSNFQIILDYYAGCSFNGGDCQGNPTYSDGGLCSSYNTGPCGNNDDLALGEDMLAIEYCGQAGYQECVDPYNFIDGPSTTTCLDCLIWNSSVMNSMTGANEYGDCPAVITSTTPPCVVDTNYPKTWSGGQLYNPCPYGSTSTCTDSGGCTNLGTAGSTTCSYTPTCTNIGYCEDEDPPDTGARTASSLANGAQINEGAVSMDNYFLSNQYTFCGIELVSNDGVGPPEYSGTMLYGPWAAEVVCTTFNGIAPSPTATFYPNPGEVQLGASSNITLQINTAAELNPGTYTNGYNGQPLKNGLAQDVYILAVPPTSSGPGQPPQLAPCLTTSQFQSYSNPTSTTDSNDYCSGDTVDGQVQSGVPSQASSCFVYPGMFPGNFWENDQCYASPSGIGGVCQTWDLTEPKVVNFNGNTGPLGPLDLCAYYSVDGKQSDAMLIGSTAVTYNEFAPSYGITLTGTPGHFNLGNTTVLSGRAQVNTFYSATPPGGATLCNYNSGSNPDVCFMSFTEGAYCQYQGASLITSGGGTPSGLPWCPGSLGNPVIYSCYLDGYPNTGLNRQNTTYSQPLSTQYLYPAGTGGVSALCLFDYMYYPNIVAASPPSPAYATHYFSPFWGTSSLVCFNGVCNVVPTPVQSTNAPCLTTNPATGGIIPCNGIFSPGQVGPANGISLNAFSQTACGIFGALNLFFLLLALVLMLIGAALYGGSNVLPGEGRGVVQGYALGLIIVGIIAAVIASVSIGVLAIAGSTSVTNILALCS